jgi:hypothetical protein
MCRITVRSYLHSTYSRPELIIYEIPVYSGRSHPLLGFYLLFLSHIYYFRNNITLYITVLRRIAIIRNWNSNLISKGGENLQLAEAHRSTLKHAEICYNMLKYAEIK